MDDAALERLYPYILWRTPVLVHRTDGTTRLACRLCIAHDGLHAGEIEAVGFETHAQYEAHMMIKHPAGADTAA